MGGGWFFFLFPTLKGGKENEKILCFRLLVVVTAHEVIPGY